MYRPRFPFFRRICPGCGNFIRQGVKYCPSCNADLQSLKEKQKDDLKRTKTKQNEIECPNCQTLNKIGTVNCISCGMNFIKLKQEKTLDMNILRKAKKNRKE